MLGSGVAVNFIELPLEFCCPGRMALYCSQQDCFSLSCAAVSDKGIGVIYRVAGDVYGCGLSLCGADQTKKRAGTADGQRDAGKEPHWQTDYSIGAPNATRKTVPRSTASQRPRLATMMETPAKKNAIPMLAICQCCGLSKTARFLVLGVYGNTPNDTSTMYAPRIRKGSGNQRGMTLGVAMACLTNERDFPNPGKPCAAGVAVYGN
jgi:hypothetical protein